MAKNKLPKNVEEHLNKNTMFNMFALVNISSLRASTGCKIEDEKLKKLIRERFDSEMETGKVEFMKKR